MTRWAATLAGAAWLVWSYGPPSGVAAFRSLVADGVVWLAASALTAVAVVRALRPSTRQHARDAATLPG